jgi:hypothetical protein
MELGQLLRRMTAAAEAKDGKGFAACFTPDGIYRDYIYGDHKGREAIADMLENYFHRDATDYRWQFFEPVSDGKLGYAWSLSSFTSTIPEFRGNKIVIDGASRFRLKDGLIEEYWESVNGGVAMAQLGVQPERVLKVLKRWAENLKNQPTTIAYLKAK